MIIVIIGGEELRLLQHGYTRKAVTQRRSTYNAPKGRGKGERMDMDTTIKLDIACNRLSALLKAGKTPVDYKRKWEEFKKKTSKK